MPAKTNKQIAQERANALVWDSLKTGLTTIAWYHDALNERLAAMATSTEETDDGLRFTGEGWSVNTHKKTWKRG